MGIRGDLERRTNDSRAYEGMKNRVMEEMKKTFRPEFLNRIDETIVFQSLTADEIFQIVDLMLERVNKQVQTQELTLVVSPEVKELLAKEGFDPTMGARPLRRAVQRMIEDPLAEEVLRGTFRPGDTVEAEMEDGPCGLPTRPEASSTRVSPPLRKPPRPSVRSQCSRAA